MARIRLLAMQLLATGALVLSLGLAYRVNDPDQALFYRGLVLVLDWLGYGDLLTHHYYTVPGGLAAGVVLGTLLTLAARWWWSFVAALVLLVALAAGVGYAAFAGVLAVDADILRQLGLWVWLGMPLMVGLPAIWRDSMGAIGITATLVIIMPLGLEGNDTSALVEILGFIFAFLLFLELAYGHVRYDRLARIMRHSTEFDGVLTWFVLVLVTTLVFTTLLTAAAFSFHDLLGMALPGRFKNSIEFNTIYGRALSVLVFFVLWAVAQTTFSRRYLAKQVD